MKVIQQSYSILKMDEVELIELAGRTCYKSEERIIHDPLTGRSTTADAFVERLIRSGHTAMIEHAGATVRLITNRGVTHELVRSRIASYAQESTRYCRYTGEMEFIWPVWCPRNEPLPEDFIDTLKIAEEKYIRLIEDSGWQPQQAREVLPNALKTEIVLTCNYREWRHIFNLRALGTTGKPHPQIQALFLPILKEFAERRPSLFMDMYKGLGQGLINDFKDKGYLD